ncbi:flagellin [Polaromonas sp. CG_23.6]|uniref:flagellin N-terminal helical domain-containing protein n=1 Tax=Polaromonas sp. CG_23.6 TaxID=2760709 RepID=UPI002475DE64|nr:flagellin [Polaromonas sp. CG_23.6]MDH6184141.1 flagellin [Polaromonas sp. CG_23.6]
MSVINSNILSLVTQNNLTKSQGAMNTAIERLSSGMRINSAKDDAAGQAIANRFTASIKGLTQASRNANDGISMAQTTEGALNEVNTNLQRIRELTVQSANGNNSAADKASMQAEITQRLDEIQRTSDQTDFNGVKVLKDGVLALKIQVGANDSQTIDINLKAINPAQLGLAGFSVVSGIDTTKVAGTAQVPAAVTAVAGVIGNAAVAPANEVFAATFSASVDADTVTFDGVGFTLAAGNTAAQNATAYASAYTGASGTKAFTASANGAVVTFTAVTAGNITDKTNSDFSISAPGTGADTTVSVATPSTQGVTAVAAVTSVVAVAARAALTGADNGKVFAYSGGTEGGTSGFVIKDTVGSVISFFKATIGADGAVTRGNSLTTIPATADPLKTLDAALTMVDTLRGSLGAVQNRFDSIIANLGTTVTNLSASRSRIEDADYATEVSNMTRAQILQQAGTSVLAKANSSTEGVLSLLR